MSISNTAHACLLSYMDQQARLNGVKREGTVLQFSVDPAVQQRLEKAKMESSPFLKQINSWGVTEQEGEKIGIGVGAPIASTNTSTTDRREPVSLHTLTAHRYRCEQTNFDTFLSYTQIDAWSGHPQFQQMISDQIARQEANDRLMMGFNGTSRAAKSDRAQHPLLQDVKKGWLQHLRDDAPQRIMKGVTLTQRDGNGKIVATGKYAHHDALVYDARTSLLDPWHRNAPGLIAIVGYQLTTQKNFKILNQHSESQPNMEMLAGNELMQLSTLGGIPVMPVPFFPDGTILITTFKNLSVYWQKDKYRRVIKDEPEYNRLSTYSSSNEGYVIEDNGLACLIEDINYAEAKKPGE